MISSHVWVTYDVWNGSKGTSGFATQADAADFIRSVVRGGGTAYVEAK